MEKTKEQLEQENQQLRIFINKLQRHISKLYTTDPMTGIPNTNYIKNILPNLMATAERFGTNLIYLCIDFEGFKSVNDLKGQEYGDKIIREFANILRNTIKRKSDAYARVGGDEFDIVLVDTSREYALSIIKKLETGLKKSFPQDNLGLHAGACEYYKTNMTTNQLRREANSAMKHKDYIFKEDNKDSTKGIHYFFYKINRTKKSCTNIIRTELFKRY